MKDKAYEIAINPKHDGYQRALASMVYRFFDQKTASGVSVNEELAQELHKPVIKKFKTRKVYVKFKVNIWAAHFSEMGSLSSKNWGVKYLLWVIDVVGKYAWVKCLKDKEKRRGIRDDNDILNVKAIPLCKNS